MDNLRAKTILGISVLSGLQVFRWVISIFSTIVLYRLLRAEDFGIYTLCEVYVTLLLNLADMGMETVIIQKKDNNRFRVLKTGTVIRVFFSLVGFGLLFGLASFIAGWHQDSLLTFPLRMMSISLIIGLIGFESECLLKKGITFEQLFLPELASGLSSALISFLLAWLGLGYWSLVISTLLSQLLRGLLLLRIQPVPKMEKWDPKLAGEMWKEGRDVFLTSLLFYLLTRVSHLFVARTLGAAGLGFYQLAFNWSNVFVNRIIMVINRVIFPAAALVADNRDKMRKIYHEFLIRTSLTGAIFHAMMAMVCPWGVIYVLGTKWSSAIVPMQILCVYGYFRALSAPGLTLLQSMGHYKKILTYILIELAMVLLILFPFLKWGGLIGGAWAMVLAKAVTCLMVNYGMIHTIEDELKEVVQKVLPSILAAVVALGVMLVVTNSLMVLNLPWMVPVVIIGITGFVTYLALYLLICRQGVEQLQDILRDTILLFKKRNKSESREENS